MYIVHNFKIGRFNGICEYNQVYYTTPLKKKKKNQKKSNSLYKYVEQLQSIDDGINYKPRISLYYYYYYYEYLLSISITLKNVLYFVHV